MDSSRCSAMPRVRLLFTTMRKHTRLRICVVKKRELLTRQGMFESHPIAAYIPVMLGEHMLQVNIIVAQLACWI